MSSALDVIERAVAAMGRLAEDLVDVQASEVVGLSIEMGRVDLRELVRHAVEAARPAGIEPGVDIEVSTDVPTVPLVGDGHRLGQVLDNLLANAIRHSPARGTIELSVRDGGRGRVWVSVGDEGPGVPANERSMIFEAGIRGRGGARFRFTLPVAGLEQRAQADEQVVRPERFA